MVEVKEVKKTKEVPEAAIVDTAVTEAVVEEELSPWYVFCSTGCGFCKKAEPVVEALNKEGYDILTLDLAEPDNAKLNQELKTEYGVQCGTPWFINAETGKGVCGFREKDVLKKWLDGEDIPEPSRPKGMPPKPPLMGASKKEEKEWKTQYNKWLKDNEHLPADRKKSAKDVLAIPRPKSDPPRPPMGPQSTDEEIDKWGEEYGKWAEENSHLPNLQPVDMLVQNFKNRKIQMAQQGGNQPPQPPQPPQLPQPSQLGGVDNTKLNTLDAKVQAVEVKLDKIMSHFGVK